MNIFLRSAGFISRCSFSGFRLIFDSLEGEIRQLKTSVQKLENKIGVLDKELQERFRNFIKVHVAQN